MEKISIIVPIFNTGILLDRCINSLLMQTEPSIKIILVNDGSTDQNTIEICDQYQKQYSKIIKVIHKKNGGVSSARNAGMAVATSEYVMFVDSDDWVEPEICEKLYLKIKENNYDIALCGFVREFYKGVKLKNKKIILPEYCNIDNDIFFKDAFGPLYEKTLLISPCLKLFKLSIIKDNHILFSEEISLGEDMLFNQDYLRKARRLTIVNEALYHYICGNQNSLTKKFDERIYKINFELFNLSKQFLNDLRIYNKNIPYICKLYLRRCFINIESIYFIDNTLTNSEKHDYLEKIIISDETKQALEITKPKDIEYKIYRIVLSSKNILLIKCFSYLRMKLKKLIRG